MDAPGHIRTPENKPPFNLVFLVIGRSVGHSRPCYPRGMITRAAGTAAASPHSALGEGSLDVHLEGIEALFLDLDGTLILGGTLIPGALGFLERARAASMRCFYTSNNSSRSVAQYLDKLTGLGIAATADDVLLSTHDLLAWLAQRGVTETWLVGTEGMRSMLEQAGVTTTSSQPACVVLGYDTEINYAKLGTACVHLHRGVPLVASHPDVVCPSPLGGLPDVGAFLALLEATTGARPAQVCGKPNPSMILHKLDQLGLCPERCAMVGDRLYTDMELAQRAGVHGILVLSGEATLEDLAAAPQRPSLVVGSVAELVRQPSGTSPRNTP
jgi:HAD superfamily hydrolase (TIGR01450 family)